MKILKISLAILAMSSTLSLAAQQDSVSSKEKIKLRFGGRVDAYVFTDTHKGVESGGGLQYLMPSRPEFDKNGKDLNEQGSLRFGVATTRLNLGASYNFSPKFRSSAFVEIDFMGAGGQNPLNLIRLRHAFINLEWAKSSVLIGQTSHLMQIDDIAPPTVIFGCGYPINPLSRPVQLRYTHQLGIVNLSAAVAMFAGTEGAMQSSAMTPDLTLRVMVGNAQHAMIGAAGSFKSITPRMTVVADQEARMNAVSGAIFGVIRPLSFMAIRAYAIVGQDLQTLSMTGMFAPIQGGQGYTPSTTVSTWLDLDFALPKGFALGLFAGYQKNLGTFDPIVSAQIVTPTAEQGIDYFYRISPRLWYNYKKLSFGLEYLFTQASWADQFDKFYLPVTTLPLATDHRVSLLARFNF